MEIVIAVVSVTVLCTIVIVAIRHLQRKYNIRRAAMTDEERKDEDDFNNHEMSVW